MRSTHIQGRKVKIKRATARIPTEAKTLLRVTIRRCGSLRKAAKVLRLPSHAQIPAMLEGRIGLTTAMKAALLRAEARAKRAYYMEPITNETDIEEVKKMVKELHEQADILENYLA